MKHIIISLVVLFMALPVFAEEDFDFLKANPNFAQSQLAGCKDLHDSYVALPSPIQKEIELQLACYFLAGEITGVAGSEQDQGNFEEMRDLDCEGSDKRTLELLRKYWGQEKEARALLFFMEDYRKNFDRCS